MANDTGGTCNRWPGAWRAVAVTTLVVLTACASGGARRTAASAPDCKLATTGEIAARFERWNDALRSGDPGRVADLYADDAVLLATLSNRPRLTRDARIDYFEHFLQQRPVGQIEQRHVQAGCNMAIDTGIYRFTFTGNGQVVRARYTYTWRWEGGRWLIGSHHSSLMPEPEALPADARH